MNQQFQATLSAYNESISRRARELDSICVGYRRAASATVSAQERRAFVEKRLWDRLLYKVGWRKKSTLGGTKGQWPGCMFTMLASRSGSLQRRCMEAPLMSPRVARAILQAMHDCDLVVRYFEHCLQAVQEKDSADGPEGRTVRREMDRVFYPQRELLEFYEGRVLRL